MGSEMIGTNASPVETNTAPVAVYFNMAVLDANYRGASIPEQIVNAAQVTPGPYWNDVPAEGADTKLGCARGGDLIGAAIEFTHSGTPSVYRDIDGIMDMTKNVIMANPGGWNYSATFGVRGDWVLRVVGEEVSEAECKK
ncbi:MAG: hypothetical protein COU07_02395 [Candidatus Harrisonbacteria bacterium CG10_big_fil_rev_8_21_14_0_10_40_38]|uniref:Uncharacterized protein n=1 Tax=Candidatus Harrisonbacteria bacterium CG10_big_fil_rev_8_21_14_0_10_40_38 TaxID=1974583 RepID=A0A2H0UU52_9BACT|nr:MAG: hypothetical protein COU07_02395 [Candidatus Harrisonbacteria bacterium CG10_big_fil_rev_8_21_14_0_10_40_38]